MDRELRRLRQLRPAGSDPIRLWDLARSLGLPVHRPLDHADGDALTTAQAFIALATHLDSFQAHTLGSLEQFSLQEGRKQTPLGALLRRFVSRRGRT